MRKIHVATSPAEAHLVRGTLETRGIRAVVRHELEGVLRELRTGDPGVSVWVADEQHELAREVLAEWAAAAAERAARGAWRCHECREQVEPQFTQCWNCGLRRHSRDQA